MSDQSESDDKTEEPTEKKLREAAEKGDVAHSREVSLFASIAASLLVATLMLRASAMHLAETLARLMDDPGRWVLHNGADAMLLFRIVTEAAATFLVPIFLVLIVAGIGSHFVQGMPNFVLDRIAPKLSKISPAEGIGRMFGRQGLIEFGKHTAKLLAIGLVAALLMRAEQTTVTDAIFVDPAVVPDSLLAIITRLLTGIATAFALVTAIDFVWTRVRWRGRMRMSRREIKDEMKQAEGDPLVKAKRRSLALHRSRRRMMADVHRATLVIANPTHYAIALRYVRAEGGAPMVVAKGLDLVALQIREIAEQNRIDVIENKPLARAMYDKVDVSQAIPAEFYKAVAEIIYVLQNRKAPPITAGRQQRVPI